MAILVPVISAYYSVFTFILFTQNPVMKFVNEPMVLVHPSILYLHL